MNISEVEDTYPLAPMQRGMLFQYQLDPRSGLYIQQVTCSLHEPLNVPAFQNAWRTVVQRHPALRTSFRWQGIDEPLQNVHTRVDLGFEQQDWRDWTIADRRDKFEEFLDLDRQRGFDLSKAPLVRLALFRMDDADYKLVWTYHHIIADGSARHKILDEVFALYDAYCEGRDLQLDRPQPYRDHIDWLHQNKELSASEAFWRQLLSGFTEPNVIDVIADVRSLDRGQMRRAEKETRISEAETLRLKAVAKQHQLTLNTLIQGAWALLISRYTGADDVVFGAVRACRRSTVEGAVSIVGLFLNTLPVRVRVSFDRGLLPWLTELREQHISVREHEQTPLSQLLSWSDVPRGTPLFESLVVFDYARLNTRLRERGGSWLNREFRVIEDPAFPLVLHAYGEPELLLRFIYDRGRFDDATVERMLGHLRTLVKGMAEQPDRPIPALSILTQNERHTLLVEWNATRVDYAQDVCLHQLFEAQVARSPDAVAVSFEGKDLTYRNFNHRANQLAHHLRSVGVGPEVLVGVCMERSLEMVIALYAILKAGGAYVPLDPEYPAERVAFMLEDTRVRVLLTQERLKANLPQHDAQVIILDSGWETIAHESAENLVCETTPRNLAYVIYTSGSTGRPKGVMNTHRGICNRLLWMQDAYGLTEADRVLQKTPFSFDVSVWEFFWPLLVGARLVVAPPRTHKDSAALVRLIVEEKITTLHFVPSMLQVFLEDKGVEKCHSLKRVICSGEALPYELQQRFFSRMKAELHNLYGPTEAAVDVTYWACQPDSDRSVVPIGRPVANTQIYLLDSRLQPVPIGVPGELHIGGVQVARGYLNRPELTADRFICDPFSDEPEARLYKTGDLARYLPDGNIEFLGRMDFQVKIRGFRIELGEIESVLSQHPAVRRSVVVAHDFGPSDRRLVAYLVPAGEIDDESIDPVRQFVQAKLPDYMVPLYFTWLRELPLTPNGKLDRRALPVPGQSRPALEQAYVAPRTKLELRLADLWRGVLKIEQVGVHDRFFELGGDSIQAALLINRLQRELDEFIYVVTIFEAPTVAEYAMLLERDYAGAVAKWFGTDSPSRSAKGKKDSIPGSVTRIDAAMVTQMRQFIPTLTPLEPAGEADKNQNKPAIFILAPPRSGTTLLRIMLAGHPRLFAATELQLLGFNTLKERRDAFTGKFSAWLEGTIRAIMEIKGCDADQAKCIMQQYEEGDYSTKDFYAVLQEWIGDRILVDKSPSYAFDIETLKKAERDFKNALYIHLVRHPYAMVRSFEKMHMDQILYLGDHPFTTRELGELIWTISHENISDFLLRVPSNRYFRVKFKDLVYKPQKTMEALCTALGLEFHPDLLQPYKDMENKMVDGIYSASTPMGDTKFHEHKAIDPKVADQWKQVARDDFLGDITWQLAYSLGYEALEATGEIHSESSRSRNTRDVRARRELRNRRIRSRKETQR